MAYHNLPVTSAVELVQQVAAVVEAAGWTITHFGTGSEEWLVLKHPQTSYLHLRALPGNNRVYINSSRTFDAGGGFTGQSVSYRTSSEATQMRTTAEVVPTLSIHVFVGDSPSPYLHVVWEVQPGYFRHINLGGLDVFVPGFNATFFDAVHNANASANGNSYWDYYNLSVLQNDSDYSSNAAHSGGLDFFNDDQVPRYYSTKRGKSPYAKCGSPMSDAFSYYAVGPNNISGRTILNPLEYFCESSGGIIPVGVVPGMRFLNMAFYKAGDEVTVGTKVWKIFPLIRKGTSIRDNDAAYQGYDSEFTENMAFAYLKD